MNTSQTRAVVLAPGEASVGTFACVPPGVVHAGFENYMRDLGQAFAGGGPPTPEQMGKIASRYDFRPA